MAMVQSSPCHAGQIADLGRFHITSNVPDPSGESCAASMPASLCLKDGTPLIDGLQGFGNLGSHHSRGLTVMVAMVQRLVGDLVLSTLHVLFSALLHGTCSSYRLLHTLFTCAGAFGIGVLLLLGRPLWLPPRGGLNMCIRHEH